MKTTAYVSIMRGLITLEEVKKKCLSSLLLQHVAYTVVIQIMQLRPLSGEAKRPKGMTNDDWEELNPLAMSTIRLHLANNVYFTVLDCDSS